MIDLLIIVIFRKYTHFISALKTVMKRVGRLAGILNVRASFF